MPVTVPGIQGALIPNLAAVAVAGVGVPQYTNGVAQGLANWVRTITVSTVDTGTAGAGKNAPLPLSVPLPLLVTNITSGMASQGLLGTLAPIFITGLSTGLSVAFLQMVLSTVHPGVGTGAGIATFRAPSAVSFMVSGFKSAGMNGPATERKAVALGRAFDITFASLIVPVAIVGPSSPTGSTGKGTGKIV